MRESELKKLIIEEFLSCVPDPRMERSRRHSLENIVVIALLAVISGADSFVAIEDFAQTKREWLATFLDLRDGVPSHDTLGRVFALLDPRALAEGFRRWTLAMTQSDETLIAIDGKTLRRSFKRAGDNAFVHMVSAWSASNRVALGQVKTDDKSNEITAIPELLELIDVKEALVSIDAAGAQTAIADKIVDKGGDYLLAVKGNQPTLHTALIEHFDGADECVGVFGVYETQEHAHGRTEHRRAWVSYGVDAIASADRWTQLSTLIRVESTRTVQGKQSVDNRYYICSRPQMSAIEALHAVRSHWSIENELHWVLDVAFREDDCRVRAKNAAANFAVVRQHALGLLKQRTETKIGIKNRRLRAGWDNNFLLRVIGLQTA